MSNTTRIAKNTLMLYFRQILILLVGLYTVRVVLNTLGAEDYGIFNVVGGIVTLFSFINTAMTGATQRFLNYAMGKNDTEQIRNVFSISLIIHLFIAVIIIILAETAGLLLFYKYLNIPPDRMSAAFFVYQFSVFITVMNILKVPYKAIIIAYEKMSFFALISVIEVLLKLAVAFLISFIVFDKLIIYSVLLALVSVVLFIFHKIYCNKTFDTSHFRFTKNRELTGQIASFSGWNTVGSISKICSIQGINIIFNIFHGVTVNAANGIANQVNSAVYTFVSNFQTAFRPQIIKSYAGEDYGYFKKLLFQTSKISYFLSILFVLPLFLNADFVLNLWLVNVPDYAVIFTQLMLIHSLQGALYGPLQMAAHARGNIKNYELVFSVFLFLNLPLSYLFLWLDYSPASVLIIKLLLFFLGYIWQIIYAKINLNISVKELTMNVFLPLISVSAISISFTLLFFNIFSGWKRLILTCFISSISLISSFYLIGLNKNEKLFVLDKIKNVLTKHSG